MYNDTLQQMGLDPYQLAKRKKAELEILEAERGISDMRSGRLRGGNAGTGRGGNSFSWFDRPSQIQDFAGDKRKKDLQDAEFIAKYGMTAEDMVGGYKAGQIQEGTTAGGPSTLFTGASGLGTGGLPTEQGLNFDVGRRYRDGQPILYTAPETVKLSSEQQGLKASYEELRNRYKAESEARINALNYRGTRGIDPAAKAQKDIYAQLERSAKLAKEVMESKMPNTPDELEARRTYTGILNKMAEMNQTPQQELPGKPERPDSEWLKFGGADPQNRYDKIWGNYKAGGNSPAVNKGWSAEEMDAYDWLQQNPNDPRAAGIKKRLGVK